MLDKRRDSSHDCGLIVPALIWGVLKVVSALDYIWLSDPVYNVTHHIDINELDDRARIDCERQIVADRVKCATIGRMKALSTLR